MTPEVDQLYKAYTEGYSVGIQLGPMGRTIERDRLVVKAKKKAARRYKMYHLRAWHTGEHGTLDSARALTLGAYRRCLMASQLKRSLRIWEFGYKLGRHHPKKDTSTYYQRLSLSGLWQLFLDGWNSGHKEFVNANLRLLINEMLLEILDE